MAFALIQKDHHKKLDNHTIPCIFLGYSEEQKAYRLMSKDNHKIIISRNVNFDEKLSPATSTQVPWYTDNDTEKDSSFSMSFLTPLTVPKIQHGLQQQAIIDPNIPNPHIPSNIGPDTYTITEGVPLTSPSTLYSGETSSSHSTH
jgi:hypothetical protein